MISRFEPELRELADAGVLDSQTTARAVALDRGEVFSLFEELRTALYVAVALIATGLGILIKNNLDRIGPVTLIVLLALVAAACYATAFSYSTFSVTPAQAGAHLHRKSRSLGGDYVLLLGALILSADLGYAESQFHWFGADWHRHLLILAIFHALTAYWLNSRLVLTVALTSLAGWMGIERHTGNLSDMHLATLEMSARALACAAVILVWRIAHVRLRAPQPFREVFEHFIANLAFWASLIWCDNRLTLLPGALLLTTLAFLSVRKGLRESQEIFVVYGVLYGAWGYCLLVDEVLRASLAEAIARLVIAVGAATLLWRLHGRIKERTE